MGISPFCVWAERAKKAPEAGGRAFKNRLGAKWAQVKSSGPCM